MRVLLLRHKDKAIQIVTISVSAEHVRYQTEAFALHFNLKTSAQLL